jgi:hypothetical protein
MKNATKLLENKVIILIGSEGLIGKSFLFVKFYEEVVAAKSFMIVNILMFLFIRILSAKLYPMPWRDFLK